MNRCIVIPEQNVQQALNNYKKNTGKDFSCVWPQDSTLGIYLHDFTNHIALDYQNTYILLKQLLLPYGYDITDCDAIYYTTSKFYIVVWNNAQE